MRDRTHRAGSVTRFTSPARRAESPPLNNRRLGRPGVRTSPAVAALGPSGDEGSDSDIRVRPPELVRLVSLQTEPRWEPRPVPNAASVRRRTYPRPAGERPPSSDRRPTASLQQTSTSVSHHPGDIYVGSHGRPGCSPVQIQAQDTTITTTTAAAAAVSTDNHVSRPLVYKEDKTASPRDGAGLSHSADKGADLDVRGLRLLVADDEKVQACAHSRTSIQGLCFWRRLLKRKRGSEAAKGSKCKKCVREQKKKGQMP